MFVHGYELLLILAKGMELFVEALALHYQWAHAKTVDDGAARKQFDKLAASFRALAANVPENPSLYCTEDAVADPYGSVLGPCKSP
jgi:hypothetical protein